MPNVPKTAPALIAICAALILSCSAPPKPVDPKKPAANNVAVTPPDRTLVPPEIVQLQVMKVFGEVKTLTMSNSTGEYHLSCNLKARGCETPIPGKNYFLFNNHTYWKLPGAQAYIDLDFIQNWTVVYTHAENVGLVNQDDTPDRRLGIYMLDSLEVSKTH
jgi:hypothetical protein